MANQKPDRGTDRITRALLACGLVTAMFVPVILIEGALRPGYEPLQHFGSELSQGPRGWVQVTNFILAGLGAVGFAVGLRRVLRDRAATAAPVLLGLWGVSFIVGGVFVTDPLRNYPPGSTGTAEATVAGLVHDGNFIPFHVLLLAAMGVLAWRFFGDAERRWWAWVTVAAGAVVIVTIGLLLNSFDADLQAGSYHGLWQRISLGASTGWLGLLAVLLRRRTSEQAGAANRAALTSAAAS